MSGHSKWATTKRQKAVVDAKRGAIFTKLANLIVIAARKGSDPESNFSLRMACDKARAANMPKDNIERAIKRGAGENGGAVLEELLYEAMGPVQTQFIIKALTDNKNRTAAAVRHIFDKAGGQMSAVLWNFEQKGVITINSSQLTDNNLEELELKLIDAGAEDIIQEDEGITIYTGLNDWQKVKKFLESQKIATESAEMEFVAKDKVGLSMAESEKIDKLVDALDECEDVVGYYSNIA